MWSAGLSIFPYAFIRAEKSKEIYNYRGCRSGKNPYKMRQPFCNYNICEMSGKSATSGFDHSDHQEQEEKQERCSDCTDDIIGNICMRSRKGGGLNEEEKIKHTEVEI